MLAEMQKLEDKAKEEKLKQVCAMFSSQESPSMRKGAWCIQL